MDMRRFMPCILLFLLVLSGCGTRSQEELYRIAQKKYGACELVRSEETKKETTIVVRDKLQGFEYKVINGTSEMSFDGTSFGEYAFVSDTFYDSLCQYVYDECKDEIDNLCNERSASFSRPHLTSKGLLDVCCLRKEDAEFLATQSVKIIQKYNVTGRLDGYEIRVYSNDKALIGRVELPSEQWITADNSIILYYTDMAHLQLDKNARFIRCERKTFADTGAELDRVVHTSGSNVPDSMDSPVTFYYFDIDEKEYYLCDFNYYQDDSCSKFEWYSNY